MYLFIKLMNNHLYLYYFPNLFSYLHYLNLNYYSYDIFNIDFAYSFENDYFLNYFHIHHFNIMEFTLYIQYA